MLSLQAKAIDYVTDSVAKRVWDILNYKVQNRASILSVLLAILIVLITIVVSKYVRRFLRRGLLSKVEDVGIQYTLLRITHYIVISLGVLYALRVGFEVDLTSVAVVFGFLSVGIGFGLQYIASDLVSGLILLFERPMRIGDRIKVGDIEGKVEFINVRTTIVNTNDNLAVILPNSQLVRNQFVNYSYGSPEMRIAVNAGVAYDSDVELVAKTMIEAALSVDEVLKSRQPEVRLREFGAYTLNFELLCWINEPHNHPKIKAKINAVVFRLFKERNIQMPNPQQDIHLRSGWEQLAHQSQASQGTD
ncbi:MAG TPA: mechanosensitive ion channel domain-containing protein [Blastocatellia bacterium]|nr:mechanosensitive ion channel domain-containing protein [Blastocatellia bacterium]